MYAEFLCMLSYCKLEGADSSMISKELKKLSRRELVDIIYQLKKNEQQKQDEIAALEEALQEKRIRVSVAGSIAEAAADITQIFSTAQQTADLYLHEIASMKEDTEKACAVLMEGARKKAEELLAQAETELAELNARYKATYEKWQQLQAQMQQLEESKG